MTRAIIHIGIEKTGSTSIQSALIAHRKILSAHGIHVSQSASKFGRHDFLPLLCGREEMTNGICESLGIERREIGNYAASILKILRHESLNYPEHTHLFSSEHCHTILYTSECVSAVKNLLSPIYSEIKIIMYLRRQDRLALSHYSTHLRLGGFEEHPFMAMEKSVLNYEELIFRWVNAFGHDNVNLRIFDDLEKTGRSVVADFGEAIRCPGLLGDSRLNKGLGPAEQQVMQIVNGRMGARDGNTIRSAISLVAGSLQSGPVSTVGRTDALDYVSAFSESNEAVRGGYFPDRSSLFDDDYSRYPDEGTSISSQALFALAIGSLSEGGRIISDLEQKIRLLEAEIAEATAARAQVHALPGMTKDGILQR